MNRYVVDPWNQEVRSLSFVDLIDQDELLEILISKRAGNTGMLIHNDNDDSLPCDRPCPFCGCRSWFSFLESAECSQGEDVFECLRCLATITRRDVIGEVEWKRQSEEWQG